MFFRAAWYILCHLQLNLSSQVDQTFCWPSCFHFAAAVRAECMARSAKDWACCWRCCGSGGALVKSCPCCWVKVRTWECADHWWWLHYARSYLQVCAKYVVCMRVCVCACVCKLVLKIDCIRLFVIFNFWMGWTGVPLLLSILLCCFTRTMSLLLLHLLWRVWHQTGQRWVVLEEQEPMSPWGCGTERCRFTDHQAIRGFSASHPKHYVAGLQW